MKRLLILQVILALSADGYIIAPRTNSRGLAVAQRRPFLASHLRAVTATESTATAATSSSIRSIGKLVFLLSADTNAKSKYGSASPVERPSLVEAARHLGQKAYCYADGRMDWDIIVAPGKDDDDDVLASSTTKFQTLCQAEVLIALGLQSTKEIECAQTVFEARRQQERESRRRLCHFALDCATITFTSEPTTQQLAALVGPYDPLEPSLASRLLPWTLDAAGRRMHDQMLDLFGRWTSDDFCYAVMAFLNQFSGATVDWVKHRTDASWEKGPLRNAQEFYAMISQCGDCVVPCLKDEKCRECIGKLTQLDSRDQATSYRTLVSYESDLLTNFSLCIFTKKNIFQCDAQIPTIPKIQPIQKWRNMPVTEEVGRALLVGHLADAAAPEGSLGTNVSWKVACGANVAYDQFPSQHQLFYPAAKGKDMWYDPVFRVVTLDGRNVWCKRHYKVRPMKVPATFRLSTLDNGVTSDEFWTIAGVADDLSWIVFHYAGAAKAVGLQYLGGLLCTPNGSLPNPSQRPEIWDCLRSVGIQPWELYVVDNALDTPGAIDAGPPPLEFYRNEVLVRQVAVSSKE